RKWQMRTARRDARVYADPHRRCARIEPQTERSDKSEQSRADRPQAQSASIRRSVVLIAKTVGIKLGAGLALAYRTRDDLGPSIQASRVHLGFALIGGRFAMSAVSLLRSRNILIGRWGGSERRSHASVQKSGERRRG